MKSSESIIVTWGCAWLCKFARVVVLVLVCGWLVVPVALIFIVVVVSSTIVVTVVPVIVVNSVIA